MTEVTVTHTGPIPTATCPECKWHFDKGFTTFDEGMPNGIPEGAVTVCSKCVSVLRFNADQTLRLLTLEELNALEPDEQLALAKCVELTKMVRDLPEPPP